MIKYSLRCEHGHGFEGWFGSSAAFERQAARGQVQCPECNSGKIERQPMAPAVHSSRNRKAPQPSAASPPQAASGPPPIEVLRAFKKHIMANSEDVGSRFAEEARAIHEGESEPRAIRGETTAGDAKSLADDGIPFAIVPVLPEDHN